jgi:hypothetical protein
VPEGAVGQLNQRVHLAIVEATAVPTSQRSVNAVVEGSVVVVTRDVAIAPAALRALPLHRAAATASRQLVKGAVVVDGIEVVVASIVAVSRVVHAAALAERATVPHVGLSTRTGAAASLRAALATATPADVAVTVGAAINHVVKVASATAGRLASPLAVGLARVFVGAPRVVVRVARMPAVSVAARSSIALALQPQHRIHHAIRMHIYA